MAILPSLWLKLEGVSFFLDAEVAGLVMAVSSLDSCTNAFAAQAKPLNFGI
jgi:hypothetical protein